MEPEDRFIPAEIAETGAENSVYDNWGSLVFGYEIWRYRSAVRSGEEVTEGRSAKRLMTTEVRRYRGPRRPGGIRDGGGIDRECNFFC